MTEKMEVDDPNVKLHLWFSPGLVENTARVPFNLDLASLTVDQLKKSIAEKYPSLSAEKIDLLYNGQVIGAGTNGSTTLASVDVKPDTVVNVVKKFTGERSAEEAAPSQKKYSAEQLHQITVALRTGFLSPAFGKTIEKLTEPEMLDNLFAIAPALVTDLIGIAIIQSPHMIFNTSEPDSMNKLAETRPWVIEAFNFIAAAIHQDKGTNAPHHSRNLLISQLLNPAVLEGDEEEMDEEEEEQPEASRSQSQPNLITREQLSQALNAIPINRGSGSSGSGRSGTSGSSGGGGPFAALFGNPPAAQPRPATAPAASHGTGQGLNIQSVLQNAMAAAVAAGGSAGTGPPQLTPEAVSRAMQEALSRLPPEQRESQLNALRDMALQLTGAVRSGAGSTGVPVAPVAPPATQPQSQPQEFQEQLRQMRELGLTNESLCILALRVSNGDVQTASELLFSGWDGAGALPEEN